jgi:hypothetical protein
VPWDSDALRKPSHVSYINVVGNAPRQMTRRLTIGLLLIIFSCGTKTDTWRSKPFDSLDFAEREILSYDSVYGDYIKWIGTNSDSVTWALYLDKSNKFAIKSFFDDKSGFFTKVPGNINVSGQWTELNDKFQLKFYYSYKDFFDSLKNDSILKMIDEQTIELDREASTIWIVNTECKRTK